jgi:hypothetical protein
MARRRPIESYPKEYWLLFRLASTKRIQIACATPAQARSTRNDLYAFRKVLAESDDTYELAKLAHTVSLSITDRTLTAEPRGTVQ